MAVTTTVAGLLSASLLEGRINWASDTIKARILTSSYTPNQDTHKFASSLTNELATANGYTAGGLTLTTKTYAYTSGTNTTALDADDLVWTATTGNTITGRYIAIVDVQSGSDSTSPIICIIDLGTDVSATGATWSHIFSTGGIVTLAAA